MIDKQREKSMVIDQIPTENNMDYSMNLDKDVVQLLKNHDPKNKVMNTQIYILTKVNDELQNVLHQACHNGEQKLLDFILDFSL